MQTHMRFRSTREGGFTLAEVLVATLVFTMVVLAALMIYDRSNRVFKSSVESGDMQQNTRAGFDKLVSDLRMAGFDYDRDGIPSRSSTTYWQPNTTYATGVIVSPTTANGYAYEAVTGGTTDPLEPTDWPTTPGETLTGDGTVTWRTLGAVYQQPDEQIEYAGKAAVVIRANFDYHTDIANEHGLEPDYEPVGGQFPAVSTSNDEIAIYALKSDTGPNSDSFTFYADVAKPRKAYPESGGAAESAVVISGVNLCTSGCNNPPYTLYRFTLDEDGDPDTGTPIASNIRSLEFNYYTDLAGTTLLTAANGTAIANGAIGGLGQYDPNNVGGTTNYDDRTQRAAIAAIGVKLVGMTGAPDPDYTNPNETIASVKKYRQYTLESHVTPRNLGLAGMAEPSGIEPGPATLTSVCVGACKVTRVSWSPPLAGNVDNYEVWYDEVSAFTSPTKGVTVPGDIQSAPVMNLVSGTTYTFKVKAINENGESWSSNYLSGTPINKTDPAPVDDLEATTAATAQPNTVTLSWTAPETNVSPLNTLTCVGVSSSGATIDPAEVIQYRIWRGTTEDFDPTAGEGEAILDSTSTNQPTGTAGSTVTFTDDATNLQTKPPANCKSYYYRIQVYDTCSIDDATAIGPPALNDPADADTGTSLWYPTVVGVTPADAIVGSANSTQAPSAPGDPTIDYTNGNSQCSSGSNSCDVAILVPKVTTDTANPTNNITVDQYRVKRERKKALDTTWTFDTYLPVFENASTDASMMSGNNVILHDTTALDHDAQDHKKWYYRYTVYALQCGTESAASTTVEFPESCGLASSVVIESGANGGDGSFESPWVMNANDSIQVTPPDGVDLDRVVFELYPEPDDDPDDQPVDSQNTPNAPFVYTWADQSDGALYRVIITMINNQGCTEQTERYILDEPIGCTSSTASQTGASAGGGVEASPWVFDAGDTVTINPPSDGGSITSVDFTLYNNATNAVVIATTTDATSPFAFTWTNQTDSVVYRLEMTVTFDLGCTQDITRFIQDEAPAVCTGATTTVSGDVSGNDGTAQATPFTLNGGDSITINPPSGGVINQVLFTVTAVSPAGPQVALVTDSSSPFTYTWGDQTDNTVYSVVATITYSSGCTETVTRYVKDEICSGATTTATGSTGSGTGLTSASPWVFDANDKVTVTQAAGATATSVAFALKRTSDGVAISSSTDNSAPFEFVWADQTDDVLYTLTITVTYTAGCTETITRYIQDQGKCLLTLGTPVITHADSGSDRIAKITFPVTNPLAEVVTLSGIKVGWARDAGHPVAVMTQIVYTGATSTTQTIAAANDDPPDTTVLSITPTPPTIPASPGSYSISVWFNIGKKSGPTAVTDLSSSWISSLCLQYTAPSYGGVTASCNLLGATSGNPTSCN